MQPCAFPLIPLHMHQGTQASSCKGSNHLVTKSKPSRKHHKG